MKIEEPSLVFNRDADKSGASRLNHPMPGLDEMELSFLELLGNNRSAASAAASLEDPLDFTGRVQVVERERAETAKSTESKAKTQAPEAAPAEKPAATEDAKSDVRKELEMLKVDMTADDLRYMKDVVIPALPILQGSVPIQQAIATDASGKLDTRGIAVSNKLSELIEQGIKTGRPVRVDLDGNSSVVLKFKNGRVSAEFLSTDKASALFLKQNLDELRSRLEAKNLPVDLLQYKEQRQGRGKKDPNSKDS